MTASAFPPRTQPLTGSSAASRVLDLATRATIDLEDAISILDLRIVAVARLPAHREYHLGGNHQWVDGTAIVDAANDALCTINLVPRELSLAAFRLDPPHEIRPHLAPSKDGAVVAALEYHFKVRAGTLIVRTFRQVLRIERITLATDRRRPG